VLINRHASSLPTVGLRCFTLPIKMD